MTDTMNQLRCIEAAQKKAGCETGGHDTYFGRAKPRILHAQRQQHREQSHAALQKDDSHNNRANGGIRIHA